MCNMSVCVSVHVYVRVRVCTPQSCTHCAPTKPGIALLVSSAGELFPLPALQPGTNPPVAHHTEAGAREPVSSSVDFPVPVA